MTQDQNQDDVLNSDSADVANPSVVTGPGEKWAPHFMTALIESADDAIISKTLDGIITSWNPGAERIFGYSATEAIGQPILLLIPTDRHNEEPAIVARIRAGERVEHYETVRQRKDGKLVDISLTISPIRDAKGTVIGASKIARDITEIKQTLTRLQASEERYKTLFNSMDEGLCVIQLSFDGNEQAVDWRYLEVNPAFEKHIGVADAEGKTAHEFLPNLEAHWFEVLGEVALTGQAKRFEAESLLLNRWFDLYVFRVGEPHERKVAILFDNITKRKRAEREREELLVQLESERSHLEFERQRLSTFFQNAPTFLAVVRGPQHTFELANPAYYRLVGHRDILGKPLGEAISEIEGQGYLELLDLVFESGQTYEGREMPARLQREPHGSIEERIIDLLLQPLLEADGRVSGVLVHGVDVTEQVRARRNAEEASRRAEEAGRLKDEFLATLSHELRTPLTAIMGWTSILQSGQISPMEAERGLGIIERNARLQAQLIEDILDVSRVITGKLRMNVQTVDLCAVIEEAVSTVLPSAQAKGIRLQRVLDSTAAFVSGDPTRLQQIVWNLLSNSIKFTPKGGRVQIRLERINSHIEIVVADSGKGIETSMLPHVFDRFRQADASTTRTEGGLGLGLAIVRHLIELHGGSVTVESAGLGQGSTFTIKLPLIAINPLPENSDPSQRRVHPTSGGAYPLTDSIQLDGLHVLVVDDQEDTRTFVGLVLSQRGARVTLCASAAEALAALQEQRPDVLLSDIGMPEEDGYSLIRRVRALSFAEGGQIPAAALTAFARVEDRVRILRSGFQTHVSKPVDALELVNIVATLGGKNG
jgi:PAS domain S-box-containing protein